MSPSYIPTKFLLTDMKGDVNEKSAIQRHKRFMERRMQNHASSRDLGSSLDHSINTTDMKGDVNEKSAIQRHKRFMERRMHNHVSSRDLGSSLDHSINTTPSDIDDALRANSVQKCDKECQADIFLLCDKFEKTFTCNRYIYGSNTCEAEIQTEISEPTGALIINNRKKFFKNKGCGTAQKVIVDVAVGNDSAIDECKDRGIYFHGSVTNDEQLIDLTGVSFDHFHFLMKKFEVTEKIKISKEMRLFIFLLKMKTGLTFSVMGAILSVHRTTVSRIFYSLLENLARATSNLVFWSDRQSVQATMPDCFKPQYADTRVIIDCTEFRIDVPSAVDDRVYCYSHYKKGFTAKVLIGITPGGFICFKSPASGGRKSDSQITIESGLIDLLEEGDIVLADKGFPEIKTTLDSAGKKVILVMPPFLEKNSHFSKEETEQTYSIAKVRIHVERIMQRLRTYQILNKIPEHMFHYIDDIIHMCCILVNLQPPIFADRNRDCE